MSRAALRAEVFERDHDTCVWCGKPATEMMHFTSRGMGGSKYRDTKENNGAGCFDCARMSDGEYGSGGAEQYRLAHLVLFGARFLEMPVNVVAWERAEALREIVKGDHE